jgi:hypothetical protein
MYPSWRHPSPHLANASDRSRSDAEWTWYRIQTCEIRYRKDVQAGQTKSVVYILTRKEIGMQVLCGRSEDTMGCFYIIPRTVSARNRHQTTSGGPRRTSTGVPDCPTGVRASPRSNSPCFTGKTVSSPLVLWLPANTSQVARDSERRVISSIDQSSITVDPVFLFRASPVFPRAAIETFWFGIDS